MSNDESHTDQDFSHVHAAHQAPNKGTFFEVLASFERVATQSSRVVCTAVGEFQSAGRTYLIPRYIFTGPEGGGDVIRIAICATIHGDEPEGAAALSRFVTLLDQTPGLAQGYALYIYPVCNPTGLEDNTRHSRSGCDLNREFWKQSAEPEVRLLESEIRIYTFAGIITLHSDDTSEGLYGFVSGDVLSEHLLEPALRAAEQFLPRNHNAVIDGFCARHGIIIEGYSGMLKSFPGVARPPFEITFETPQKSPVQLQVNAFVAALRTMLVEYRGLISFGQNI